MCVTWTAFVSCFRQDPVKSLINFPLMIKGKVGGAVEFILTPAVQPGSEAEFTQLSQTNGGMIWKKETLESFEGLPVGGPFD